MNKKFIATLLSELQASFNSSGLRGREDIAAGAISNESMSESLRDAITGMSANINGVIDHSFGLESLDVERSALTQAQLRSAILVAPLALNPGKAIQARNNFNNVSVENIVGSVSAADLGVSDSLDNIAIANEAFDGQVSNNAIYFSIVYNLLASKQDAFGELFFPTIAIDPRSAGANVEVRILTLINEVTRSNSGAQDNFGRVSLTKALNDPNVLGSDRNRLHTVFTTGVSDTVLDAAYKTTLVVNNETFETAPIIVGKKLSLLGVSQTAGMLARGAMDNTDALDRRLNLESIYFDLTAVIATVSTTQSFKANVIGLPFSNFTYSTQDSSKDLSLSFTTTAIGINDTSTKFDGSASTVAGQLPAGFSFTLETVVNGTANTETGSIEMFVSKMALKDVRNAAGDLITSGADYDAVKVIADTAVGKAIHVEAYTTNSNLRTRGQILSVDVRNQVYNVPVRSGITILKPAGSTDGDLDNDATYLAGQITVAGIKTSLEAVRTVKDYITTLASLNANGVPITDAPVAGVARYYLDGYFNQAPFDLAAVVDSIKSSDRQEDIRESLRGKIKDEALKMYTVSKYGNAQRVLDGNINGKTTVIVGTDPRIAQYIGGGFDISDTLSVKVAETNHPDMVGLIVLSFGVFDSARNTKPNALNFGQMFWSPEISTDVVKTTNNAQAREVTTQPRFLHTINLPVLSVITVTNIEQVLGKVTQNNTTV